jgi:hypothetical protein
MGKEKEHMYRQYIFRVIRKGSGDYYFTSTRRSSPKTLTFEQVIEAIKQELSAE